MKRLLSFIFLVVALGFASVSNDAVANTHTLTTIANGNGSIAPAYNQQPFAHGDTVTVNIFPDPGFAVSAIFNNGNIVDLTDANVYDSDNNRYPVTMDMNRIVEVFFTTSTSTYLISYTAGPDGSISTAEGTFISSTVRRFNEGDAPCFTITPDDGYEIEEILVNGLPVVPIVNPYCFDPLDANQEIHVTFKALPVYYDLEIIYHYLDEEFEPIQTGQGSTSPWGEGTHPLVQGTDIDVDFYAGAYWVVHEILWNGDPVAITPDIQLSHSFGPLEESSVLEVTFRDDGTGIARVEIPSLSISPNPVNGIATIKKDADVIFTHIDVVDIMGNVVMNIENPENTIDFTALAIGNYIVRFHTAKGFAVRSIIKN